MSQADFGGRCYNAQGSGVLCFSISQENHGLQSQWGKTYWGNNLIFSHKHSKKSPFINSSLEEVIDFIPPPDQHGEHKLKQWPTALQVFFTVFAATTTPLLLVSFKLEPVL